VLDRLTPAGLRGLPKADNVPASLAASRMLVAVLSLAIIVAY